MKEHEWFHYVRRFARKELEYSEWVQETEGLVEAIKSCSEAICSTTAALEVPSYPSTTKDNLEATLRDFERFLGNASRFLAKKFREKKEEKERVEIAKCNSSRLSSSSSRSERKFLDSKLPFPVTASTKPQGIGQRCSRRIGKIYHSCFPRLPPTRSQSRRAFMKSVVGHDNTVYAIISLGFIASIVVQAFAVLRNKEDNNGSGRKPMRANIDSNFYSTLSQTFTAILSIFTIIIPILRQKSQQELIQHKPLWYFFLILSLLTSIAAAAVYPWQGVASSIIAYVSTAAQLAATLQVILGQSKQVQHLEYSVARLRESLDEARGR
jgi:hypothetical protein